MRYRNGSASDAGFVTLSDNWVCGGCGCTNCGCNACARCGWRWGGVVQGNCGSTRTDCGNARNDCQSGSTRTDCGNARNDCQSGCSRKVQRCADTLQVRGEECDRAAAANTHAKPCAAAANHAGRDYEAPAKTTCAEQTAYVVKKCDSARKVGIVYGVEQELDNVYESPCALKAGTLFPELHKPMNGYCPDNSRCALCGQAEAFALWELRLYLNTHPDDQEALCLFRRLCAEAKEPNYASTFLTDECCGGEWGWVSDPWPWEKCFNRCE